MMTQEATPCADPIKPVTARRALILDDNEGNRLLLRFAMQLSGVELAEAATGNAALEQWSPGLFSFAFLDIELPDINGLEVARRIRASDPDVCIVMCSTNDDPYTISTAVAADCDLFLVKPFQLDSLLNLVKNMDRTVLRQAPRVLVVDNMARQRWHTRTMPQVPPQTPQPPEPL